MLSLKKALRYRKIQQMNSKETHLAKVRLISHLFFGLLSKEADDFPALLT